MTTKYLSPEGLERLKEELKELKEIKRPEIIQRIAYAKEQGDLRENAEYHEAKDAQAFIEGRIIELDNLIKNSVIVDPTNMKTDQVRIGSSVQISCNGQKMTYQIVGTQEADPMKGRISHESPLGKAFLGKKVGDAIEIMVPAGKLQCKVLNISIA